MNNQAQAPGGGGSLLDFQLTTKIQDKKSLDYGKALAQYINSTIIGTNSYFITRNNRFAINRRWANGRIDIQSMFADRLELNGKFNYVNINYKAPSIVNTIVSRLVSRWMQRNEKINVTATDTLSITQKNKEYEEMEFELRYREMLKEMEAQVGVPLTNQGDFQPETIGELEMWRQELQRLPEEILFETNTNDSFAANGWFDVLKEKMLNDSAITGFVGTYTWMDEEGVIHEDIVEPESAFYSYTRFPDFRDTAWRGRKVTMKITELRKKYGAGTKRNLTEEQIFKIAQTSKNYQLYDNIRWLNDWNTTFIRPYDDWNINVIEFELKTLDKEPYTVTKTKTNKSTLVKKGVPAKLDENQEYVEDSTWNIYRGVYACDNDTMLEWGIKKNMIRPQDPKEMGNCEFSYSFYMYQNYDMRNLAIPEKIEEPCEQMILARLKIQQLVAKMIPAGAAVNVDALQELDLGLAEMVTPKKAEVIWEQTGRLYYRGRDAEGNPIPVPIQEISNSGFVAQMQSLIELYRFHFSVLKDELGEDPNLITQAATPRVAAGNIQTAVQESDYATGYIYQAYVQVMAETAKKAACLMHASVRYGAKAYRGIMGQKDVKDRIFGTRIQMLPTEAEIQQLQLMLNQAIAANADLVLYLNSFQIMRLAKENIKLAELQFENSMRKMIQDKAAQASKNAQENAQVQQASAEAKVKGEMELEQMKAQISMQQKDFEATKQKEVELLKGFMQVAAKDESGHLINILMPAIQQLVPNITIPLIQQNKEMIEGIQNQELQTSNGQESIQEDQGAQGDMQQNSQLTNQQAA